MDKDSDRTSVHITLTQEGGIENADDYYAVLNKKYEDVIERFVVQEGNGQDKHFHLHYYMLIKGKKRQDNLKRQITTILIKKKNAHLNYKHTNNSVKVQAKVNNHAYHNYMMGYYLQKDEDGVVLEYTSSYTKEDYASKAKLCTLDDQKLDLITMASDYILWCDENEKFYDDWKRIVDFSFDKKVDITKFSDSRIFKKFQMIVWAQKRDREALYDIFDRYCYNHNYN